MPKHEGSAPITMEKNNNIFIIYYYLLRRREEGLFATPWSYSLDYKYLAFDSFGIISYYFLNFLFIYIYIRAIIVVVAS